MRLPICLTLMLSLFSFVAFAEEPKSLPDTPAKIIERRTAISVEHDGIDPIGARLSTRLKELFNGSNLFLLEEADKPKFRILISSVSEFADRPEVGSAYAIVWVFSQNEATLRHFLAKEVGVLTPDGVNDLAAKLLEKTDNYAVRYSYIFPENAQ